MSYTLEPGQKAIDFSLTSGKPVSVPMTNPIGCYLKGEGMDAHWMPPEACDLV